MNNDTIKRLKDFSTQTYFIGVELRDYINSGKYGDIEKDMNDIRDICIDLFSAIDDFTDKLEGYKQ